jgi:excisionase family DNA binding protein
MTIDNRESRRTIKDLQTHPTPYVTASDLARYWRVGLKRIYRLVDDGSLAAIRLGPRLLRIWTEDAIRFDQGHHVAVERSAHPVNTGR